MTAPIRNLAIPVIADIEAEQSVLGSILIDRRCMETVRSFLRPQHFFLPINGEIFRAMLDLETAGGVIDLVQLTSFCRGARWLEENGIAYLASLVNVVPTSLNAEYYAKIVVERAVKRQSGDVLLKLQDAISNERFSGYEVKRILRELVLTIEDEPGQVGEIRWLQDLTEQMMAQLFNPGSRPRGILTGIDEIDRATNGLLPGNLVIIAARPSHGKSSLAMSVSHNAAVKLKVPTLFFSLEMTSEELWSRLLSIESRVPTTTLRMPQVFDGEEAERIKSAAATLYETRLEIRREDSMTVERMISVMSDLVRTEEVRIVVIDYLQIMGATDGTIPRHLQLSHVLKRLKEAALSLRIPVVLLSQVGRQAEGRLPLMADMKEAGAIEETADTVIALYQPAVYDPETTEEERHITQVGIVKNRNGPRAFFSLWFDEQYTYFRNMLWDAAPEQFAATRHTELDEQETMRRASEVLRRTGGEVRGAE